MGDWLSLRLMQTVGGPDSLASAHTSHAQVTLSVPRPLKRMRGKTMVRWGGAIESLSRPLQTSSEMVR